MKCPACERTLTAMTVGDIEVDLCQGGCGGVWFDKDELLKFDEPFEFPGAPILSAAREPVVQFNSGQVKKCPRCADEVLVRQFIDIKNHVEIDQCWSCSGIWLDVGELNQIRSQYASFEDRRRAVNAYVDECLKGHTAAMSAATKEAVARHDEELSSRFKAFIHGFRALLQGDEL